MKKVILSMVCLFAFSTLVNAASSSQGINCVEMAMEVGNWAEEGGASYEEAYEEANEAYEYCVEWQS